MSLFSIFFFLNRSRVIYFLATHWKCPCFICSGDLHNAVSYPLCPLSTHLSASSLHLPFLWKGEAAKVGGGMPEGTGIWLGNRSAFLHSPVFWDHGLHSALHRQTKRKITKWENRNGLLGIMLLLNRVRMCIRILSIISGRTDTLISLQCAQTWTCLIKDPFALFILLRHSVLGSCSTKH